MTAPTHGRAADETAWARIAHLFGLYKQSKYVAEHEVLRAGAEGLPVVLVQPTLPLGPGDRAPTPTGKTVLDFLNGRMPGWLDTALTSSTSTTSPPGTCSQPSGAHRAAPMFSEARTSSSARSWTCSPRRPGLPRAGDQGPAASGARWPAHASGLVEGRLLRREPSVPLEGARMASTRMIFNDARARSELGYSSRPAVEAIVRSARWYADNGYVSAKRLARIRWSEAAKLPPTGRLPIRAEGTTPGRSSKGPA